MRRVAGCAVVALVLLATACGGGGGGAAPSSSPTPDLDAETARMSSELTGIEGVTSADVRLRADASSGRQVTVDAATDATAPGEQRAVLEAVTEAGWHTTAFVPTEVRATLVGPDGTTLDARDLGFPRRGADAAGLYAMFGAPAADEDWQP